MIVCLDTNTVVQRCGRRVRATLTRLSRLACCGQLPEAEWQHTEYAQMSSSSSFLDPVIDARHLITPVVYLVGIAVGIYGFWLSRKCGYLVIAAYFLVAAITPYVASEFNHGASQKRLSPQQDEQYKREIAAVYQKYFPVGAPATICIPFPLGAIILVSGLWLVARRETRQENG